MKYVAESQSALSKEVFYAVHVSTGSDQITAARAR